MGVSGLMEVAVVPLQMILLQAACSPPLLIDAGAFELDSLVMSLRHESMLIIILIMRENQRELTSNTHSHPNQTTHCRRCPDLPAHE